MTTRPSRVFRMFSPRRSALATRGSSTTGSAATSCSTDVREHGGTIAGACPMLSFAKFRALIPCAHERLLPRYRDGSRAAGSTARPVASRCDGPLATLRADGLVPLTLLVQKE